MTTTNLFYLFDTLKADLGDLHPSDRLAASARLVGRPALVSNQEYRLVFSQWRRGVAL